MSRAREIAGKYAMDGWSGDALCVSVEGCEGAIRDFAQQVAEQIKTKAFLNKGHWGNGMREAARLILDAAGIKED